MKIARINKLVCCFLITISHTVGVVSTEAQDAGPPQSGGTEDYRLQSGDTVSVSIFGEPDMDMSVTIGKSNSISFRLIGQVNIRGYTVPELEKLLRVLYMKDYFVDPQVRVNITRYHSKYFHVSGAVEHPGRYDYPEEGTISLAQAVAMGGGVDEDGNTKAIALFRHKKAGSTTHALEAGGQVVVYPGDTLVVPRLPSRNISYIATVSGEVRNPGNINLGEAGKLDLITALAMAGGYSRIANQKVGIIQRKQIDGRYKSEEVPLKEIHDGKAPMPFVNEGDILIIKESRW